MLKIVIKFGYCGISQLKYILWQSYLKYTYPLITQYVWFSAQRITVVYGIITTFEYNNQIKGWWDLAMWPTCAPVPPTDTHKRTLAIIRASPFNGFDDVGNWLIWFLVQFQNVMLNWNSSIRATISKSMFKTTPSLTHHVGSCQAVILPAFRQSRTSTSWRA